MWFICGRCGKQISHKLSEALHWKWRNHASFWCLLYICGNVDMWFDKKVFWKYKICIYIYIFTKKLFSIKTATFPQHISVGNQRKPSSLFGSEDIRWYAKALVDTGIMAYKADQESNAYINSICGRCGRRIAHKLFEALHWKMA